MRSICQGGDKRSVAKRSGSEPSRAEPDAAALIACSSAVKRRRRRTPNVADAEPSSPKPSKDEVRKTSTRARSVVSAMWRALRAAGCPAAVLARPVTVVADLRRLEG